MEESRFPPKKFYNIDYSWSDFSPKIAKAEFIGEVLFLVLKFLLDSPTTRHLNEIAIDIGAYSVVKDFISKGRGGGQVVCVLAFNSVDLSSNPAEVYSFHRVKLLEKNENKR